MNILLRFISICWVLLSSLILITDVMSYHTLISDEDWFCFINRDYNVDFIHAFLGGSLFLALVLNLVSLKKMKQKSGKD